MKIAWASKRLVGAFAVAMVGGRLLSACSSESGGTTGSGGMTSSTTGSTSTTASSTSSSTSASTSASTSSSTSTSSTSTSTSSTSSSTSSGGADGGDGGTKLAVDYTFDTTVQGWMFNTFQNTAAGSPLNLANLDAGTLPTLTYDAAGITGGSLKVTVTFTDYNQYVDPNVNFTALNLTGKTLHAQVKLESGTFTGYVNLHASSNAYAGYTQGAFPTPAAAAVTDLSLVIPPFVDGGTWDPATVVQIGVQIGSGSAPADAGPFPGPVSIVLHIDTVTD